MTGCAIPIYVETRKEASNRPPMYSVIPLFVRGVASERHPMLGQALDRLRQKLKRTIEQLASLPRQTELRNALFQPRIETETHKLVIELRRRRAKMRAMFLILRVNDRRVVFSPSLPSVWFEVGRGESVEVRASEVYRDYFRTFDKQADLAVDNPESPESKSLSGEAWVQTVEIDYRTKLAKPIDANKILATLFGVGEMNGADELAKVGRSLDALYPDELSRAILRDFETTELDRVLRQRDRRPVALVGPRLSGKSTVLSEVVWQRAARRTKKQKGKGLAWQLSPQRLIAGMMYVGQWENRLESIVKHAQKRDLILCFDDFLGLYQAGRSRDSDLCMADVLRPRIIRRDLRIVAEFTPEGMNTFRERDRGLADQFHVIPVPATSEDDTWRVLLAASRQLESAHRVQFGIEIFPAVMELTRRFVRDAAFPGKAVSLLRELAVRFDGSAATVANARMHTVHRDHVLTAFSQRTGLDFQMLSNSAWPRPKVVEQIVDEVSGQSHVVEAMADVASMAKAGLSAPDRPLATMLFMGPTGVGKTHCAQVLARVLFGDNSRLLRFDMNEYQTPGAVTRLAGSLGDEGLLTSAVRRQPFSVVLLDEIEKAHPDAFDLLLQAMGEGRLTDATGRTSDFTQCVIVMTSNLGVTDASRQMGFVRDGSSRRRSFVEAAERFFRPEFYNRIDYLLPFDSLDEKQLLEIARRLLSEAMNRDGLVRRRSFATIDDRALAKVVEAGFHPQLGARAIKRAVEREILQPMAASLARMPADQPMIASIFAGREGVLTRIDALEPVEEVPARSNDVDDNLPRIEAFLVRAQHDAQAWQERARKLGATSHGVSREQVAYYTLKEQLHVVREGLNRIKHLRSLPKKKGSGTAQLLPTRGVQAGAVLHQAARMDREGRVAKRMMQSLHAAEDIHAYFREVASSQIKPGEIEAQLRSTLEECAIAQSLLDSQAESQSGLVVLRPLEPTVAIRWRETHEATSRLGSRIEQLFSQAFGFHTKRVLTPSLAQQSWEVFSFAGPGVMPLLRQEAGLHVWCRQGQKLDPYQMLVFPLEDSIDAQEGIDREERRLKEWIDAMAQGVASVDADPWPIGKIVRYYEDDGPAIDLRTGRSIPTNSPVSEYRSIVLSGLPLPPEWKG